jgi:hypothetical protein
MRARPTPYRKPRDDGELPIAADTIFERDFEANRPNRKSLADSGEISTSWGWF